MKNILLGNMSSYWDFGDANKRYQQFLKRGRPAFCSLIESLVLFDEIVVPTNDYMPLALIAGVLGERPLLELLDTRILHFARYTGAFAYVGGGGGIRSIIAASPDKQPKPMFRSADEAAGAAVSGLIGNYDRSTIAQKAAAQTIAVSIDPARFRLEVIESARGLLGIDPLFVTSDLDKLPGIKPNQVRILGSIEDGADNSISRLLRIGEAAIEAYCAEASSSNDIYCSAQVARIFRAIADELIRQSDQPSPQESFMKLREISGLPDVGEAVMQDKGRLTDLLKLRESTNGKQFREWFHQNCRSEPEKVVEEYVKLTATIPWIQSGPAKVLRFTCQGGIGVGAAVLSLNPAVGVGVGMLASAFDTFFVERLFRGNSPKFFIEELGKTFQEANQDAAVKTPNRTGVA